MGPICKKYQCGAECAAQEGCGWSSSQMGCRAGKETSEHELAMCVGDENRVATADCSQYTCGWNCAQAQGCGWSTKKMTCRPRQKTTKREYTLGQCDLAALAAGGVDTCFQYTCGADCYAAPGCGWSATHSRCIKGKNTRKEEMRLGDCPPVPVTTTTVSTKTFCAQFACGATCATAAPICGWSSGKTRCTPGAKTSLTELKKGSCTADDLALIDRDNSRCAMFHCGRACQESCIALGNCDSATACGWSSRRGKCMAGGRTHKDEMDVCTTTSSSTSTVTTVTSTTTTITTVTTITTTTTTKTVTTTTTVTTPSKADSCVDYTFANGAVWQDNEGDSCSVYKAKQYCSNGELDPIGWGTGSDTFADYADNVYGYHGGQMCCSCGGGTTSAFTPNGGSNGGATSAPCSFFSEREIEYFDLVGEGVSVNQNKAGTLPLGAMLEKIKNAHTCARLCLKAANNKCAGFEFKRNQRFCQLYKVGTNFEDNSPNKIWAIYKRHSYC